MSNSCCHNSGGVAVAMQAQLQLDLAGTTVLGVGSSSRNWKYILTNPTGWAIMLNLMTPLGLTLLGSRFGKS